MSALVAMQCAVRCLAARRETARRYAARRERERIAAVRQFMAACTVQRLARQIIARARVAILRRCKLEEEERKEQARLAIIERKKRAVHSAQACARKWRARTLYFSRIRQRRAQLKILHDNLEAMIETRGRCALKLQCFIRRAMSAIRVRKLVKEKEEKEEEEELRRQKEREQRESAACRRGVDAHEQFFIFRFYSHPQMVPTTRWTQRLLLHRVQMMTEMRRAMESARRMVTADPASISVTVTTTRIPRSPCVNLEVDQASLMKDEDGVEPSPERDLCCSAHWACRA